MIMERGVILPQSRIEAARSGSFWQDQTILDYFDERVANTPDKVCLVEDNSMTGQRTALSYRQLDERAARIAMGLINLGIQRDDIISCQLPNWWQFVALHLAAVRIGAITNPLMPIFRERELEFMLGWAESKLLVVPEVFRGYDHVALATSLRERLPELDHVLVIGAEGNGTFDALLHQDMDRDMDREAADALFAKRRLAPDDIISIMYTSGTTGEPKGVMHTSNTLCCNLVQFRDVQNITSSDVTIMPSPLAHQTGFLYGIMNPILTGGTVVLQDIWNPRKAIDLINGEGVTFTIASTPFLADLCEAAKDRLEELRSLRLFVSAGAPIPRDLVRMGEERLGAMIISLWGMTENGAVCCTRPDDPPEKTFETDGRHVPGMACMIADDENQQVPVNEEGRLLVQGAGMFVGYLKRPDLYVTDQDGWFDTGDLARMDGEGYIRITGRSKDVIIRGGENIPIVEIENLLHGHPAIAEVAIVAMPDPRLGERGCAFVVTRQGETLTHSEMVLFLQEMKCAKQYMPERLEIVAAMPRTPSGKIQKFNLRALAKNFTPNGG